MKILIIFFLLLSACITASVLNADIYSWTDENGEKHYSNVAPPDTSNNVKNREEISNTDIEPINRSNGKALEEKVKDKRSDNITKTNATVARPGLKTRETGLQIVNDPATAEAIEAFNKKKQEIGLKCRKEMEMKTFTDELNCMCSHMAEIMEANQAKIDAFLDLMQRRPELVNRMVKIEGVFGNWFLDPDDMQVENRNNVQFFKKRYNCG